ncbi:hypothetical protein OF83DRAFT_1086639 [Amylostereum chailletii]|nr:hypothetical protein OF83DRAFT_1086639 [Amylostereum chailletii]
MPPTTRSAAKATASGQDHESDHGAPVPPSHEHESDHGASVPPSHDSRTLVLCFNGTGDSFDTENSNVVQFFSTLKKGDRTEQMVYYQAGIGTYTSPQIVTPLRTMFSKTVDMAVANNLDMHVIGGYEFLMENYKAEDKICLFGFSRGAHTARVLAGMIHKVGLLPAGNHQQVPFAYKMYTRVDEEAWGESARFKKMFSMDGVDIWFLGVWDTVTSVGALPRNLPFTAKNPTVKYFRHAISLDEHRAKFKSNHWQEKNPHGSDNEVAQGARSASDGMIDETSQGNLQSDVSLGVKVSAKAKGKRKNEKKKETRKEEEMRIGTTTGEEKEAGTGTKGRGKGKGKEKGDDKRVKVLQVYFVGCHSDIGGGAVSHKERHSLARIPLRWMIRQCFQAKTGILFRKEALEGVGLKPKQLHPEVLTRPPPVNVAAAIATVSSATKPSKNEKLSEEEEDLRDVMSPIHDELERRRAWWILELVPFGLKVKEGDHWGTKHRMNLGRAREIPVGQVHIHRTVKIRKEAETDVEGRSLPVRYVPRAYIGDDRVVVWED